MFSLDLIARLAVAAALLWAAVSKVVARDPSVLKPYGVPAGLRGPACAALTGAEVTVGMLVLAGVPGAAVAAFTLGLVFVVALARVRARGITSLKCGCFGATERSTNFQLARAGVFTGVAGFGAFAVSYSNIEQVRTYLANQAEHHRRQTFQEEFLELLRRHNLTWDDRYIWD